MSVCDIPVAMAEPLDGPVRFGLPFVVTDPDEYAASCGVTPLRELLPLFAALIEAEPPTRIWVAKPLGASPPAHPAHGGSRNFTLVTTVWIFLIATGLVSLGT